MLPTFIIIGAMKCGTGSLWHYLRIHPEIFMSETKELDYFILEKNYKRGIKWYESNFVGEAKEYGEASPNYTKYPTFAGVPQRMFSVVPGAKLIYVIRDPIDRIMAHYVHNYSLRKENGSISDVLSKLDGNYYVSCSRYYMQLQQFLNYYPKENILVIASEELRDQRPETLKTIFRFLNVDDSFDSPEYERVLHKSSAKRRKNKLGHFLYTRRWPKKVRPFLPSSVVKVSRIMTGRSIERPTLDPDLEERLILHLKDDVDSLRNFTGHDFPKWRL